MTLNEGVVPALFLIICWVPLCRSLLHIDSGSKVDPFLKNTGLPVHTNVRDIRWKRGEETPMWEQ